MLLHPGDGGGAADPRASVSDQQHAWAVRQGYNIDSKSYLPSVEQNLFQHLSDAARAGIEDGSGDELSESGRHSAKLKALHSSAALALNVFDYWTQVEDRRPLEAALDLTSGIDEIQFERKFGTGLGAPANVDVVLPLEDGTTLAMESKFTEWMTRKPTSNRSFSEAYFPVGRSLWADVDLVQCQRLAAAINEGAKRFVRLDAPQLLKHSLGLARELGNYFQLWYVYFDAVGQGAKRHREEIAAFADAVGPEIHFRALSYQKLFEGLTEASGKGHREYLEYPGSRYFLNG